MGGSRIRIWIDYDAPPWLQWVSKHGTFTVSFDAGGRVAWKEGGKSRGVLPWQRWWKAIWER
jgi:hypothetical protein